MKNKIPMISRKTIFLLSFFCILVFVSLNIKAKTAKEKFLVQIETNGTIFRDLPDEVKIICSPKISNHKYHILRPDILEKRLT